MSGKGMSFLNKKSWHTGGMPMLKKVWAAEEREKEEQRTIAQLRREKEEERAVEDSRRLQAQQGLVTATPVQRLEWMYAGQAMSEAVKQEQYLLGAQVKEVKPAADSSAVTAAVAAADERWKRGGAGSVAAAPHSQGSSLEAAARLREDPLVAIMREQHRRAQPAPAKQTQPATAAQQHSTARDTKRRDGRDSSEQSSRGAHRHMRDGDGRRGEDDEREQRERQRVRRTSRGEREGKRKRQHHYRSRSPDYSHSHSSHNYEEVDEKRRRRRRTTSSSSSSSRRRSSRSRSRSRSTSREADAPPSHIEDSSGREKGGGNGRESRTGAAGNGGREEAAGRRESGTYASDSLSHAARGVRDSHQRETTPFSEQRAAHTDNVFSLARDPPVSAPFSAASVSLSPVPSTSVPSVVSSAFVSSTSAFGGRLGLIVPAGAPPPLAAAAPASQSTAPHSSTAQHTPPLPAPSPPPPPQRSSVSLSGLSEVERAERLRAMRSDADSLVARRREQARVTADDEQGSQQSERVQVVSEVVRLSAPLFKTLRTAAIEGGRLSSKHTVDAVEVG